MIVSFAHKFIFLKTQKTAGTSVELALAEICGPDDIITQLRPADLEIGKGRKPQNYTIPRRFRSIFAPALKIVGLSNRRAGLHYYEHMNASALRRKMDANLFDSFCKVAIVRNAWDREVSLYYWATRNISPKPTFDAFVRRRVRKPNRKTFDIYSIRGEMVADRIIRYEDLEAGFASFVADIGLKKPPKLPSAKSKYRNPEKRDYKSYYTDETALIVQNRYAAEISHFNMAFGEV